jgi:hypothetical protein
LASFRGIILKLKIFVEWFDPCLIVHTDKEYFVEQTPVSRIRYRCTTVTKFFGTGHAKVII